MLTSKKETYCMLAEEKISLRVLLKRILNKFLNRVMNEGERRIFTAATILIVIGRGNADSTTVWKAMLDFIQ